MLKFVIVVYQVGLLYNTEVHVAKELPFSSLEQCQRIADKTMEGSSKKDIIMVCEERRVADVDPLVNGILAGAQ